ncbi:glycoside hydrolase family 95 protein [Rhizobium hidalgonense]|uniref:Glycoside hydrolase family 95 protein n=1 Tax=Rhizobium hidalgonense TaxID=1538159 RepID=A0AAJ2LQP0_9HYPH|nr:glycoside hydrolase family 95 protein [Rhizobium hidalgonense]MDR9777121.1 glycoside hydrolase family 95 protein [Rhizobium hidalgonense]MDR9823415.1 glycoside hydrolase family 95 protein [Rhizobium hidalgonense]
MNIQDHVRIAAAAAVLDDDLMPDECHVLRYDRPGRNFNEALPVGNGRLGAMIGGATSRDVVCVNDDRFWAGKEAPAPVAAGPLVLAEVRRRLFAGDISGAEALVEQKLLTEFNQPYLPAADLWIDWNHERVSAYGRRLDLRTATVEVEYETASLGRVRRTCFCSFPDHVLVLNATFENAAGARTILALTAKTRHSKRTDARDLIAIADAPSLVDWPGVDARTRYGENIFYDEEPPLRCCTMLRVIATDVRATSDGSLVVGGSFTILVATSVGHDLKTLENDCRARLHAAERRGYGELLRRHVEAHAMLYGRASLRLESAPEVSGLATDDRLRRQAEIDRDPGLEALLFNFGRYLMISASRPGCRAINLQGIWNDRVQPPWWSNYTLNINLQMNYWPAEPCNLAECHQPLFDFVKALSVAGSSTASIQYGMRGWVAHHQVDGRFQTTPVGVLHGRAYDVPIRYSLWNFGGAWLCQHFWQHFLYGGDVEFLRDTAWPVMRGAAEFYLDWMVELPDGTLTTAPSTSPENSYLLPDGTRHALSVGATMDIVLLREFFSTIADAAEILGLSDDAVVRFARAAVPRLPDIGIGSDGQLMEWSRDLPQAEHPHRHVSHLYGVFPGAQISSETTPDLAAAAARVLIERGDSGTGWSFAWKTALWARLGRPDMAYRNIGHLLNPVEHTVEFEADLGGGLYPNLLAACPPFNIDANFGYTGAVAEMLVQSQSDDIVLLPALPSAWSDGEAGGLRCRGQVEIDMRWKDGVLEELRARSEIGQTRVFRYGDESFELQFDAGDDMRLRRGADRSLSRV